MPPKQNASEFLYQDQKIYTIAKLRRDRRNVLASLSTREDQLKDCSQSL